MEPRYEHAAVEKKIYEQWEKSGYFNPDVCIEKGVTAGDAELFSIVLPPPNVTGTLHMGHAATVVIEDIMVRYHRMRGNRTLWIPGTDHAAIATQSKVEKDIVKTEKKNRHDLGREEFLKRVRVFAQESHDTIVNQVKRMGASLDWSREAYTLDEKRGVAVRTAFKKMYDLGLIYRGHRVINWDVKGQTTISDDEIVYEERKAKLYTFRYGKLKDGNDFPIAISTTRLETKFGDTAVAVHPSDERYQQFVGKEFDVDYCGTPIHVAVVADESVEKDFGTGALGVTPAHSMIDWEIAQRHNLPFKQIIDEYGKMTVENPLVQGKKTAEAREIVAEELRKRGLIEKEEEISQNVATAERTGGIIEPLPKLQWFIAVNKPFGDVKKTLKELMIDAVKKDGVVILPERFERIYFNWIDNLRDWCISRQIWFGHQIPVWYKGEEIFTGTEAPTSEGWTQDPDTLDTWFSSGLWPFSTLGWPEKTDDLATYFPNSVLETGYDIIFFWVARMILMSEVLMGGIPFRRVYLHGLVRDDKGRKMSKSIGNIIDPLTMADKYGADATRISLVIGASAGNDIKLSEDRIRGYRNFSTKLWNIARFIQMNKPGGFDDKTDKTREDASAVIAAREEIKELDALKREVTKHIDDFEFHLAGEKLYHYLWHRLADEIIEAEKKNLSDGTDTEKAQSYALLEHLLLKSLTMLHPFMPFITEEVYQIFRPGKMLMVEKW
jgi:valyl-tRNA synthetase